MGYKYRLNIKINEINCSIFCCVLLLLLLLMMMMMMMMMIKLTRIAVVTDGQSEARIRLRNRQVPSSSSCSGLEREAHSELKERRERSVRNERRVSRKPCCRAGGGLRRAGIWE